MEQKMPDVQSRFRKWRDTGYLITNIYWIMSTLKNFRRRLVYVYRLQERLWLDGLWKSIGFSERNGRDSAST